MNNYNHILAKSESNGGIPLKEHTMSVAKYADLGALYFGLDREIARYGAFLHDIGKASQLFQNKLKKGYYPSPQEMNFRHEIASLFFLPLINKNIWPQVIDMIVAHHKSIYKDGRGLGILDLMDYYCEEEVFNYHITDFEKWSKDALGILNELGIHVKEISLQQANEAYQYAINHCRNKGCGWSVWKGLMVGADHFASAIGINDNKIPQLFTSPKLEFYNRKNVLYPLSLVPTDLKKQHTFVKAPTGAGKTDFLLKRCRGRVFYTLPFQASINSMFERIKNDLKNATDDIRVLHSTSRLVIENNKIEEKVIQDKFGAAIKVLTPHQLASIVFGTRGYETILFDLKNCDVILDEIHTYSDVTQAIVLKIVEILYAEGCRIHIGTATMPSVLEKRILKILGEENTQIVTLTDEILDTFNRHLVFKSNTFEELFPVIEQSIKEKQKILIVCNRVSKAQAIFSRIKELYPDIPRMLIHNRFRRIDRNVLEKDLKEIYNISNDACIVVSTQVVEVSLDISFDLMITETAPIDAMIQRFGRINRIRSETTIGKYKAVYVIAPPDNGKEGLPYTLSVLQKSYNVLPDGELLEEKTIQELIDRVYPNIEFVDINLDAVYTNCEWRLRELWHFPKSALLEKMEIDSIPCILEKDKDEYMKVSLEDRILYEIPVSYNSVRWKNLEQLHFGSNPFVVPDKAYSPERGLDLSLAIPKNYNVENQLL
ncbi:MAG TPA: CRISPR-associated helicase/endonuclease Cas3 [Bacteroidales bacterium]|nr:CRISPR-associated helicase/endonuclease Cas3 [Bacteroidales bacterium]